MSVWPRSWPKPRSPTGRPSAKPDQRHPLNDIGAGFRIRKPAPMRMAANHRPRQPRKASDRKSTRLNSSHVSTSYAASPAPPAHPLPPLHDGSSDLLTPATYVGVAAQLAEAEVSDWKAFSEA